MRAFHPTWRPFVQGACVLLVLPCFAAQGGEAEEEPNPCLACPPRPPVLFSNVDIDVAWTGTKDDLNPFFTVVPAVSLEEPRLALGAVGRGSVDLSEEKVDSARLELAGSVAFAIHQPWKYRVVCGLARSDQNTDPELEGTAFDPAGQAQALGIQVRARKQLEIANATKFSGVILGEGKDRKNRDTKNYVQDALFTRPERLRSWTLGFEHRRDEADGVEAFSSSDTWYFEYVFPFAEGDGGTLSVAAAYGSLSYPRSQLEPHHQDDLVSAGARYRFRFPKTPLQFFASAVRASVDSDLENLDVATWRFTAGIRIRLEKIETFLPDPTPENQDSTTTSPADLGPPRPRPNNP